MYPTDIGQLLKLRRLNLNPLPECSPCAQVSYSKLMYGLQQDNIQVNRKVLSELAVQEPFSFKALVDQVRMMRGTA